MSSVLKEKIRKIFKGTKRLIGMKRGKMLQNEQKNRGESGILEVEKASGIEAWEFPRLHCNRKGSCDASGGFYRNFGM